LFHTPADAANAGIGLVPEDRQSDGLFMERHVAINALSASVGRYSRFGVVRERSARTATQAVIDRLAVKTPSLDTAVENLSGGNQQKVVLARWLIAEARVLLLDDPTVGVDVGTRTEIYRVIDELLDDGVSVIVASSDLDEIITLADRVVILRDGRSVMTLGSAAINHDVLLSLAVGGKVTDAIP
jgi:ABC-type sugar transport system ATPase subunit